jgi:hypothetical protein
MEANYGVDDCGRYNIILFVQDKRFEIVFIHKIFHRECFRKQKICKLILHSSSNFSKKLYVYCGYLTVLSSRQVKMRLADIKFFVVFVLPTERKLP